MRPRVTTLAHGVLFLLFAAWPGAAAYAQTQSKPFVTAYPSGYFTGSHPSSAMEMVTLLPGFRFDEGNSSVRGYGGAIGNVLIDGQPPSSKQDKLSDVLGRISGDQVERVEIVRPGAAGFDFQGYQMLANVVIKAQNAPHGKLTLEDLWFRHGQSAPSATAQFSVGTVSVLDLSANANHNYEYGGTGFGFRNNYRPDGTPTRLARYQLVRYSSEWNLTGGYRQPLFGGTVRLSGLFTETRGGATNLESPTFPTTVQSPGDESDFRNANEAGLQYNHRLWEGAEVETTLLRRSDNDYNRATVYGATEDASLKHSRSNETIWHNILRQQGSSVSVEGGFDATINTLINLLGLTKNKVNIPLPAANIKITETRGEIYSSLTWHAAPTLIVEPGLRYEMSKMKQSGDSNLTKQFGYLKPRVKLGWQLADKNVLRILVEREAGQLNFNNFITNVLVNSNSVSSGNKDLVPETLWRAEVSWEHAFTGGSLVTTARHEMISNTQDRVAVVSPQGTFDSLGNIGDGRRDEFQFDLVWPLTGYLSGITLQGTGLYRFSETTDANTGHKRTISNDRPWEGKFSITQDFPSLNLRWGATYAPRRSSIQYRFNETQASSGGVISDIFVEYKPSKQWLIRLTGKGLLDSPNNRTRDFYFGNRANTAINFTEDRGIGYGPAIGLNIQRSFGQ